jgi:hypothetical protein
MLPLLMLADRCAEAKNTHLPLLQHMHSIIKLHIGIHTHMTIHGLAPMPVAQHLLEADSKNHHHQQQRVVPCLWLLQKRQAFSKNTATKQIH